MLYGVESVVLGSPSMIYFKAKAFQAAPQKASRHASITLYEIHSVWYLMKELYAGRRPYDQCSSMSFG